MQRKNVKNRLRGYAGQRAKLLLACLNVQQPDPLVWDLFKTCQALDSKPKQPGALVRRANALLSDLAFRPCVVVAGGSFGTFWTPLRKAVAAERLTPARLAAGPRADSADAVHSILDLLQVGALGRIRSCVCGTWFYAANAKRRVCYGGRCRWIKFLLKHPDWSPTNPVGKRS